MHEATEVQEATGRELEYELYPHGQWITKVQKIS